MRLGLSLSLSSPRGASEAFSPDSVSGLIMWLDPSQDAYRTDSGSTVTALTDITGNGNNATAGIAPAKSTLNGLTCMSLTGTEHLDGANFSALTEAEIFIVTAATSMATLSGLWYLNTGGDQLPPVQRRHRMGGVWLQRIAHEWH